MRNKSYVAKKIFLIFIGTSVCGALAARAATLRTSNPSVGSCAQTQIAPWIPTLNPLTGTQFTTTPDDTHSPEVSLISSATQSLYMEMYHLSDSSILTALKNLAKKGVDVQIVLDSGSLSSGSSYAKDADTLTAAGVKVYKSSKAFTLTHTKTFLVDQSQIYISTMNLVGAYQDMRDYGVTLTDPTIIADFVTLFKADVANSQNGGSATPTLNSPNLVLAPTNAKQKIIDFINSASVSVQLTVENLGDTDVVQALANAAGRCHIRVEVLVPECTLSSDPTYNFPALTTLSAAGVTSRVMGSPSSATQPYMHAKTIVIDNTMAFIGSENFSISSLTGDRELGVIVEDPTVISSLNQYFNADWSNALPLPTTTPSCPSSSY